MTWSLFRSFLSGRSTQIFFLLCILSFAFSQSVVLCAIGLMDGFEATLKSALRKNTGDLRLYNRKNFFSSTDPVLRQIAESRQIAAQTELIKTEAFLLFDRVSKGAVVHGVDVESYLRVTGTKLKLGDRGIALGSRLALSLGAEVGDELTLALAKGNVQLSQYPRLEPFTVSKIVSHDIFEQDQRWAYVEKKQLQEILDVEDRVNNIYFKLKTPWQSEDRVAEMQQQFASSVQYPFGVQAYWDEYAGFLQAVAVEKFWINIILQLIVVVALFNVSAFVIFLGQRKAQDFFLYSALGLAKKQFLIFWVFLLLILWLTSALLAIGFQYLMNLALQFIPLFHLPAEIYVVENLQMKLDLMDYGLVFFLSGFWILLLAAKILRGFWQKNLVSGLRQQFS